MTIAPREFRDLLAELPTLAPGVELILRPDANGATATLRQDGATPRVFRRSATGVVELLPQHDDELPGASLLADPARLQRLLAPHLGAIADSRVVAWRPGRRAVVRVATAAGAVHWLKLLDRKTHRRAAAAFAAIGGTLAPMLLVKPGHGFDDVCAHLAPSARGASLRAKLAAGDEVPLTLVARGLSALGYTDVRGDLPTIDFARVRSAAVDMLQKAAGMRADLHPLAARLLTLPGPATAPVGFVHGDLHDKQLFLDAGSASLIDLEGVAVGDPRFDVVNLAEHVRLRDLQQTGRDSGFADVLLARCGAAAGDASTQLFRIAVRARLCGVYALRPRWRPLVDLLLHETTTLMENLA